MSGFNENLPNTGNKPPRAATSIGEDVIAAGASVGVDVEKLRNKYLSQKLVSNLAASGGEDEIKLKQQLQDAQRMREMEARANGVVVEPNKEEVEKNEAGKKRLDNIIVCARCSGQGLVRQTYNFQIRESNCEECEGEGILYKGENGVLLKPSQAPQVSAEAYNVEGIEKMARELAESCGVTNQQESNMHSRIAMAESASQMNNDDEPPPIM